jgi:cell division GTPase FtsZ
MIFEFEDAERNAQSARMKVVGIGGGGGNAVNRMIDENLQGVDFISDNTEAQALTRSMASHKIQIGKRLPGGSVPARGPISAARPSRRTGPRCWRRCRAPTWCS